eukprot:CCRYP_014196-RB/>CCRYP_014196-RB protein AED:0.13 eAED:0.13 QI:84/0.75/0.8/1/0.75/0.8/5/40/548
MTVGDCGAAAGEFSCLIFQHFRLSLRDSTRAYLNRLTVNCPKLSQAVIPEPKQHHIRNRDAQARRDFTLSQRDSLRDFPQFSIAYRDENGYIIYSLAKIRKNYIRSGWFFMNLLACIPGTGISHALSRGLDTQDLDAELGNSAVTAFFIFEVFKLLRLARFGKLVNQSSIITRLWENINVETALALKFMFLIALIAHWIACLWGLIAFIEAKSFGDGLTTTVNWIGNWYNASYVEGGLDPIGWENYLERYWLCLFWAIQSITSIGYGNIVPVTTAEFAYANFLMLACGVFWAYIIGALVDAVASMGSLSKEYFSKMDEANQMLKDFTATKLPTSVTGSVIEDVKVSKRVRRFITEQRDRATTKTMESQSSETLADKYPTLCILSQELQKVCVLHLVHSLIETVPYLSSKYLSPDEQAEIALKSYQLEFAAGETFREHSEHGRGILIFRHGFGFTTRNVTSTEYHCRKGLTDHPVDVDEVLVDDDFHSDKQLVYHFAGFTKVFFIPRSAIMNALRKNERAWKECARWRYFLAAFVLCSLEARKMTSNRV